MVSPVHGDLRRFQAETPPIVLFKLASPALLMGEPHHHRLCTVTNKIRRTYAAFIQAFGRYYEGDPMTILSRIFFERSSHRSMDVCYFTQSGN
jgi:hypothetical protein